MSLPLFLPALAVAGFLLSYLGAILTRRAAWALKAIDHPKGGRKIHQKPTPLFGGIGIGMTIILLVVVGIKAEWFSSPQIQPLQLWGFVCALLLLLGVGYADDRWDISAWGRAALYFLACVIIVLTGTSIHQITSFTTPSLLGDVVTLGWLMAVLYATKFLDGLDGLVAGQTVIGAGLIVFLCLMPLFYQPPVALLAIIVFGAFAGFLPSNLSPAKQFLGEEGSVIAGFSLGFLSIVSGAKMATAFMAIGIPLADAIFVVLGRCLRGVSPFKGDDTHLHFKLLRLGLSQRQVVGLYWGLALGAGILAFGFQTRGKFLLILGLLIGTAILSWFAGFRTRARRKL